MHIQKSKYSPNKISHTRLKSPSIRKFTHNSHHNVREEKLIGKGCDNNAVFIQETQSSPSCSELNLLEYFRIEYLSDFFNGLANNNCITKISPLVSNFNLDNMINSINKGLNRYEYFCQPEFFIYIPHCFIFVSNSLPDVCNWESWLFNTIISLLHNRLFIVSLMCGVVYCQSIILRFVHRYNIYFMYNKTNILDPYIFYNIYNYIINRTSWIAKSLYFHHYRILHYNLMYSIYNNISHMFFNFRIKDKLSKNKLLFNKILVHNSYRLNISLLSGKNLNIIYASLTVIYVLLGWLLDYLSHVWVLNSEKFKFMFINLVTFSFWVQHSLYGLTYIIWLLLGVITTNGIYFSMLSGVTSLGIFNIVIFSLGSTLSLIASSLWFLYGNPTQRVSFNLQRVILNESILPLLARNNNSVLLRIFYHIISPAIFNIFTSLRRSIFEWWGFLGMVFSTYASWGWYYNSVFSSMAVWTNIVVWTIPSFILGYSLIYIEDLRPRFSHYYYGIVYISFWTSICFATNSVLVGYIDVNNAAYVLGFFIPINFVLALIYPLPLYRYNINSPIVARVLHMFGFILLTAVTLLSAGTIWYIIYPV